MIKEEFKKYVQKREEKRTAAPIHLSERVWISQIERYVEPFRIYGNFYYVGDDWACVHIVDTGEGLLMFDAGNCGGDGKAMLMYNICKMGFRPEDIRWCVLSHAHIDHIGCARFLQQVAGTRLYMGEMDTEMMKEHPELVLLQEGTDYSEWLFEPDYSISDGETIRFGKTEVSFRSVPGHTPGTIACFFDVEDQGEKKRVGYFGGYGFNTMNREYLEEIGDRELRTQQIFLDSIDKVLDEKVDIFMANHTDNGDYFEKMRLLKEGCQPNPFINTETWNTYLKEKKCEMKRFMKESEK